jgi:propionyl-CoA carboxylase alpha chain
VATNRDLLVRVLREPEFPAGHIDTAYLDRHPDVFAPLLQTADDLRLACLAAALAASADPAAPWRALPSGWRNGVAAPQRVAFIPGHAFGPPAGTAPGGPSPGAVATIEVTYRLDRSGGLAEWSVDGEPGAGISLITRAPDEVVVERDGVRRTFAVHRAGGLSYVDCEAGSAALVEVPRFAPPAPDHAPGSLLAPMPGAVGAVTVQVGAVVAAGDPLLTIEAMKMEHTVRAPEAGTVTRLLVAPGQQVEPGTPLAVVASPDPTAR